MAIFKSILFVIVFIHIVHELIHVTLFRLIRTATGSDEACL